MSNTDFLRRTFDNHVETGRSGLIALCGNPCIENGLEYIIYFHSLNTVYISHGDWGTEYFDADATGLLTRALEKFAGRADTLTLEEIGKDEPGFLRSELACLLWAMLHDEIDTPNDYDESEKLDEDKLAAPDSADFDDTFTLFGSGDLETDIDHFRLLAQNDEEFHVDELLFSLGTSQDDDGETVYELAYSHKDSYTDDTGEQFPVIQFNYVLYNYDWRVLYARTRAFVQLNRERLKQLL